MYTFLLLITNLEVSSYDIRLKKCPPGSKHILKLVLRDSYDFSSLTKDVYLWHIKKKAFTICTA
jgi:hypothetical protein